MTLIERVKLIKMLNFLLFYPSTHGRIPPLALYICWECFKTLIYVKYSTNYDGTCQEYTIVHTTKEAPGCFLSWTWTECRFESVTCVSVEVTACLGLAWLALAGNTTGVPYTWTLAKQSHMAQNTKKKHTNAQITKNNCWPFLLGL